ncbi:tRNA (cytosine(32)/uridine(32)-2'-O)-methyltransferase TrmJ [Volucribacter amazonae]|uniref:tRNA (cytidine/uridine-2'-O-)-methyltransferase TrmJ n=1 Tax=Volucribacter amazonae TaxID=256731 RepID=A0A9X4PBY1_9PAST|nr:tRNA (cytosine(32)/uridine(32)-2'-O)-methyltransferase TrmJ [Volucribacter amazonae]MDG6894849.1 tRNA (cytosine(32)/uridine(32)-2'-O)-methyltransferase TrmJ [Volucribacter amazonae]
MLAQIKIVLVETSHSGNIGSTARAMKTMGLTRLCLVNPLQPIDEQAISLSANASDILQQAEIQPNLACAVADCQLVVGTSARSRHIQNNLLDPRQNAQLVIQQAMLGHNVAIVFGRERVGLTNAELLQCHYHLAIPANPAYSSLNLAMAVQLISYELRMAWLQHTQSQTKDCPLTNLPTAKQLEHFLQQTEALYQQLGFIQNQGVMQKLRRFYYRSGIEQNELNILQGMLSAVKRHIR